MMAVIQSPFCGFTNRTLKCASSSVSIWRKRPADQTQLLTRFDPQGADLSRLLIVTSQKPDRRDRVGAIIHDRPTAVFQRIPKPIAALLWTVITPRDPNM